MAQRSRQQTNGSAPNAGADYMAWLTTVPQDQREAVASIVEAHAVTDYKSFGNLAQAIMAEILRGRITPEVAKETRMWAELLFTALATEASASGRPELAQRDIVLALVQAASTPSLIEPSYANRERVILEANNDK